MNRFMNIWRFSPFIRGITRLKINPELLKKTKNDHHVRFLGTKNSNLQTSPQDPGGPVKNNSRKSTGILFGIAGALTSVLAFVLIAKSKKSNKGNDKDTKETPILDLASSILPDEVQTPLDPPLIDSPTHIPYLIIGAGAAAFSAFKAIRVNDPTASVLMVTEERHLPYARPPLSKDLWITKGKSYMGLKFAKRKEENPSLPIYFDYSALYSDIKTLKENKNNRGGVSVLTGKKVIKIDPDKKKAILKSGEEITFDKCLIATGGKPKNIPLLENAPKEVKKRVTVFRTVDDFNHLDEVSQKAKSIAVLGGGFLGSELACSLAKKGSKNGMKVYHIFPEKGVLWKVLPQFVSRWTTEHVKSEGAEVLSENSLESVNYKNGQLHLQLNSGKQLAVDELVVAVGIEPCTELARTSGLEIDDQHGGFRVNSELESRSNIWVAGDASCFYDIKLGRRRVEHHDHAEVSGRVAGRNMTGESKPYRHQSEFWSDIGSQLFIRAVGITDSSLPTVGIFTTKSTSQQAAISSDDTSTSSVKSSEDPTKETNQEVKNTSPTLEDIEKGVVFYLKDNIVVGVLLINIFRDMLIARLVINDGAENEDLYEVAKLFFPHPEDDDKEESSDSNNTQNEPKTKQEAKTEKESPS